MSWELLSLWLPHIQAKPPVQNLSSNPDLEAVGVGVLKAGDATGVLKLGTGLSGRGWGGIF